MRYEIARKLCAALDNIDEGLTVEVSRDMKTDSVKVTARKVWHGVVLVPAKDLEGKDDDTACAIMLKAGEEAAKIAIDMSKGNV